MSSLHLLARVRDEHYAFPVQAVREVAGATALTPVPGAPPAVRGVHNVRGEVVPVLDLGAILGLGGGGGSWLVLAEHGGVRAGLAVDAVLDVTELPGTLDEEMKPLAGSTVVEGRLVGVVDVAAVLAGVAGDER